MKRSTFWWWYGRLVTSAAIVIAGSGCKGDSTQPDLRPSCSLSVPEVTMGVGAGTTPEFSWTPQCGVSQLVVDELDPTPADNNKWDVGRSRSALLFPPIHYGAPPNGSTIFVPASPLEAGHTYRVTVYEQVTFERSVIASATFTP